MKLLFCKSCHDIVKLSKEVRHCECGESSGRYIDNRNVEIIGEAMVLGIDNRSFYLAYRLQKTQDFYVEARERRRKDGEDFTAFFIAWGSPFVKNVKKLK